MRRTPYGLWYERSPRHFLDGPATTLRAVLGAGRTPSRRLAIGVPLALALGAAWAIGPNSARRAPVPAPSIAALAKEVAAPGISPLLDVSVREFEAIEAALRPVASFGLSKYIHAMHLFGPSLKVADGLLRDGPVPVADLLLDIPRSAEIFGGGSILSATRYGLRAMVHREGLLGTDQSAALAHRGQYLAVLGGLGVAADRPIRLADGSTRPVGAVRDDLAATFSLEGEIAWDAIALAYYNDGPFWSDKFGRRFTFDQVVEELDVRDPGQAACGGTHDVTALVTLMKVDRRKPILSDSARRRVLEGVTRRVGRVVEAQLDDGSWDLHWHLAPQAVAASRARSSPLTSGDSLIVTGHLLEWLILLPEPLRPDPMVYRRAATWLAAAITAVGDDPVRVDRLYCPLIHATRSLRLLSRAVEPPAGR